MGERPVLFVYDNYRLYLSDWLSWKKQSGRFSLRNFSRRAGFGAPNIYQLVMAGRRNLTRASAEKFSYALGHTAEEKRYFWDLTAMNQARSLDERMQYYQRLIRYGGRRQAVPLEQAQLRFLRHWLAPVVYEMMSFPQFQPSVEWISSQFSDPPGVAEVRRAIADLVAVGLVEESQNGGLVRTSENTSTGDNIQNIHILAFHESALERAADALNNVPMDLRHFQVLITAASSEALRKVTDWWQSSEAELNAILADDKSPKTEVFQIGWHMFPLLKR